MLNLKRTSLILYSIAGYLIGLFTPFVLYLIFSLFVFPYIIPFFNTLLSDFPSFNEFISTFFILFFTFTFSVFINSFVLSFSYQFTGKFINLILMSQLVIFGLVFWGFNTHSLDISRTDEQQALVEVLVAIAAIISIFIAILLGASNPLGKLFQKPKYYLVEKK